MDSTEPRYRLRLGETITGYMRKVAGSMTLYSKDSFWWTGHRLPYQQVDEWTGLKDMNNRYIYEWDILYYKLDPDQDYLEGVILWETTNEEFGIRDVAEANFIPLFVDGVRMFNPRQLKVFSYLFLNPELQKQLGVEE